MDYVKYFINFYYGAETLLKNDNRTKLFFYDYYKVIDNIVGIEPIHNAKATSNTPVALEKWLSEKCSAKFSIIVDYFIKK